MRQRKRTVSSRWRKLLALLPGYDCFRGSEGYYFDEKEADRVIRFFEEYLVHTMGEKAFTPLILEPWQKAFLGCLFGWKRESDGLRRYKVCLLFVPRKNGKSLLAAGVGNYALFCDDREKGRYVVCAAADREQARMVFDVSRLQVESNSELSTMATPMRHVIETSDRRNRFRVLSAEAGTKHGLNVSCGIVDELHAQPDRELVDVLATSQGARTQPLMVYITTSDYERPDSICNEIHDYASKVRDGIIDDSSFLPVIYEASRDDNWMSPKTWKKANPNLGVSISLEFLERECAKAKESPAYENTFKRLYLNIRTEQETRWIPIEKWDACNEAVVPEDLIGRMCYAGLDLSNNNDITALVLLFPYGSGEAATYKVLPYFWIPSQVAEKRQRNRVPYVDWVGRGHIEIGGEENINQWTILRRIHEISRMYRIKTLAFDPWGSKAIAQDLAAHGVDVVEYRQSFSNFNAPMKELEVLVGAKRIAHGGNPVLRWMASNVMVRELEGNIRPDRKSSSDKIDGIVGLAMAVGVCMADDRGESVYATRGALSI